MLNPFVIKKWIILIFNPVLTVLLFYLGAFFWNFWAGLGMMGAGVLISFLLGRLLLANPFTDMLEGKGMMVLDMNSTGVLTPFLVQVNPPFVRGQIGDKPIIDSFDREAVNYLKAPITIKNPNAVEIKDGKMTINIDENEYNAAKFALYQYPVLIYNRQISSFITKDWFGNMEKDSFAEHIGLYLNRKMEELTSVVRDFGRMVVESLKPGKSLFGGNWWVWVLIFILLAGAGYLLYPYIATAFSGASGALGGGAITPA